MSNLSHVFGVSEKEGICVWEENSGQVLHTLEAKIHRAYFCPNDHLFVINGDPSILVYKWRQNKLCHRTFVSDKPVSVFTASNDFSYALAGFTDGRFFLWLLESGTLLTETKAHHGAVTCLQISEDVSFVVSGGQDGVVKVFLFTHLTSPGRRSWAVFSQHCAPITSVHTTPDGIRGRLYSSSLDQTVNVYSIAGKNLLFTISFNACVTKVLTTIDQKYLFASCTNGEIARIDLFKNPKPSSITLCSKQTNSVLKGHEGRVTDICLTLDGVFLISTGEDGRVLKWSVWQGNMAGNYISKMSKFRQIFCVLSTKSTVNLPEPKKFQRTFNSIENLPVTIEPKLILGENFENLASLKRKGEWTEWRETEKKKTKDLRRLPYFNLTTSIWDLGGRSAVQ